MRVAYVAHPDRNARRIKRASSPVEHSMRRAALSSPSKGNKLSSKNDEGRFLAAVVLNGPPPCLSRSILFSYSISLWTIWSVAISRDLLCVSSKVKV
jgi:hypothetical protein